MGSVDIQRFNAHWDLEPCTLPLTRPRSRGGTLSRPTGEGRGEGLRFMGSKDARFGAYWDDEPQICKCLRINETIGRFMES